VYVPQDDEEAGLLDKPASVPDRRAECHTEVDGRQAGTVRARRALALEPGQTDRAAQAAVDGEPEKRPGRHTRRGRKKGKHDGDVELNMWDKPPVPTQGRPRLGSRAPNGGDSMWDQLRERWKEVLTWCVLVLLAAMWTYRAHDTHKHRLVRHIRPGQRIRWAAKYLASSCDAEGKFRYLTRANGLPHPEKDRYDLAHHAWVISALAQYALYEKNGEDTHSAPKLDDVPIDVEQALLRGSKYLVDHIRTAGESQGDGASLTSLAPSRSMTNALALWIRHKDGSVSAAIASTAMALTALVQTDAAVGGNVIHLSLLRSLGSFLVELQQRNGLFYEKVVVRPHLDRSMPAPAPLFEGVATHAGLAMYALLLLADRDREHIDDYNLPASSWLKPAVRGLMGTAVEEERMQKHNIHYRAPMHHWVPVAAAELLRHDAPYLNRSTLPDWYIFSDHFASVEWSPEYIRTTVTDHTGRMVQAMLTEFELLPRQHHEKDAPQHGALTKNGEAFTTAQRLRAIHAALSYLPHRTSTTPFMTEKELERERNLVLLRDRLQRAAKKAADYLSSLQITYTDNPSHGGFSRAMVQMHRHISAAADDFNSRINEVRMDTVADVLVALMANRRMLLALEAERQARLSGKGRD